MATNALNPDLGSLSTALHSSATVKYSRSMDDAHCIFSLCSHPNHTISENDEAMKLAIPSRLLRRMSKAKRQALVVQWDTKEDAFFHKNCWERIVKEAVGEAVGEAERPRKRQRKMSELTHHRKEEEAASVPARPPPNVLTPSDKLLILEVSDTAERFETATSMRSKAKIIADLIRTSSHTVVFTGAGISSAAGMPTYRGTDGIDVIAEVGGKIDEDENTTCSAAATKKKAKGKDSKGRRGEEEEDAAMVASLSYTTLKPTLVHRMLQKWMTEGRLQYIITQNCDDLHQRAGTPRDSISELHGNVFIEYCERCQKEYRRPYCVDLFSTDCRKEKWYVECGRCHFNHYTGRKCTVKACGGRLKDTIVNFGDLLFDDDILGGLKRARAECRLANVVLCLGSSMTVTPARDLPRYVGKSGSIAIVNLQDTELDASATVRVWGSVDAFVSMVDEALHG